MIKGFKTLSMKPTKRKWLRRTWLAILATITVICIYHREILHYGWLQGKGQFKVLNEAKPIADFLNDPAYPDSLKMKLRWVQEIRQYAFDSLGLTPSESYTEMYDHGLDPILWMVTASEAYELKAFKWDYPLLGRLSYRGYFDRWRADTLASELTAQGYDVRIGQVSGWSTLGWFDDPLLSGMLKKDEAGLARLLIHELTHGTLFVPDRTAFNENLATFVGDIGAEEYLSDKYGEDAEELVTYRDFLSDMRLYSAYMKEQTTFLNTVYDEMLLPDSTTKRQAFDVLIDDYQKVPFATNRFRNWGKYRRPNNADFISYLTYREHQDSLNQVFTQDYDRDFEAFLDALKQQYGHAAD